MNLVEISNLDLDILKNKNTITKVFNKANYHIQTGQWHYLKGHNAIGKTLLLKLITNTLERRKQLQIRGEIRVMDKPIDLYKTVIEKEFSFIRQENYFISNFTVLENIITPLLIRNVKLKEAQSIGLKLLVKFNLEGLSTSRVDELSGGQKKLVSIMMGLITNPKLLLIDEPINELDKQNTDLVINYLKELKRDQKELTVILTSHIEIDELCDDTYLIDHYQIKKL